MKSRDQYATLIRAFFRHCDVDDPSAINDNLLRDYIADLSSDHMRQRAIHALSAFYAFVTREAPLTRDPSAELASRVRALLETRDLEVLLLDAGVDAACTHSILWRDVGVVGMLGERRPNEVIITLPADAAATKTLFKKLIAGIRERQPQDVEHFLDDRVVADH
jgi:hypothetical protein